MNPSAMEIEASVSKEREGAEREGEGRDREFNHSCQHLAVFHVSLSLSSWS